MSTAARSKSPPATLSPTQLAAWDVYLGALAECDALEGEGVEPMKRVVALTALIEALTRFHQSIGALPPSAGRPS